MPAPNRAATSARPGSAPAQVSLIRSAPASQAATATGDRQVSTLITRSGKSVADPADERHHPARSPRRRRPRARRRPSRRRCRRCPHPRRRRGAPRPARRRSAKVAPASKNESGVRLTIAITAARSVGSGRPRSTTPRIGVARRVSTEASSRAAYKRRPPSPCRGGQVARRGCGQRPGAAVGAGNGFRSGRSAISSRRSRRHRAGRPARRWCRSGRSETPPAPGPAAAPLQFRDRQPVAGQLHAQRRPSRGRGRRPVFQSTTVSPPSWSAKTASIRPRTPRPAIRVANGTSMSIGTLFGPRRRPGTVARSSSNSASSAAQPSPAPGRSRTSSNASPRKNRSSHW